MRKRTPLGEEETHLVRRRHIWEWWTTLGEKEATSGRVGTSLGEEEDTF